MSKYKRASNGSGTISKMSGARRRPWRAMAPGVENEDGVYVRQTIGYFETRADAVEALKKWVASPHSAKEGYTLQQLHDEWQRVAYRDISKSTQQTYDAAWKYFDNEIRELRVQELRALDFQNLVDAAEEDGKSRSTMEKIKALAVMLENYAIQNDVISKNYASFVKLPKTEANEKGYFTDLQLKTIEEAAGRGVLIADIILVMCFTGWRIQELCNLTRFSYDPNEQTLTGGLKTEAGKNRVVFIPEKVQPIVQKYAELNGPKLFCWWFDDTKEYRAYTVKKLRAEFYTTLEYIGIDYQQLNITPHSTRHTYNSMLNKAGVDMATRMKLMGQVSEATNFEKYTHADLEMMKDAVRKIG